MNTILQLKRFFIIIILVAGFGISVSAQTIKGTVSDAKTSETLIGATINITNGIHKFNTSVKLDGSYLFKNVPAGIYTLEVTFVGYKTTQQYSVEVIKDHVAILNITMLDNAEQLNEVTVKGRGNKESYRSARADEKNSNNTINVVFQLIEAVPAMHHTSLSAVWISSIIQYL